MWNIREKSVNPVRILASHLLRVTLRVANGTVALAIALIQWIQNSHRR